MKLHYDIDGENFTAAGEASGDVKRKLKSAGFPADFIRRVSIAMYEGEINTVIHGGGGVADVVIDSDKVTIKLQDFGPGIPDVEKAMQAGWSTAPDSVRALGFGAGMGLPNMKKYSSEMEIETEVGHGTTVKMVINLNDNKQ